MKKKQRRNVLPFLAFTFVLCPGIGAVGAVLAELDPFLTQETKDPVRLYLADKLVVAEESGPLLGVTATRIMLGRDG
jgi:hypothetical protein